MSQNNVQQKVREWKWAQAMRRLCHRQMVAAVRIYKRTGDYDPVRKAKTWKQYWDYEEAVLSLEIEYINSKEDTYATEEGKGNAPRGSYADRGTARISI